MNPTIKMVAVDVDGTFVRSDYTYDVPRFRRILSRMQDAGCQFAGFARHAGVHMGVDQAGHDELVRQIDNMKAVGNSFVLALDRENFIAVNENDGIF